MGDTNSEYTLIGLNQIDADAVVQYTVSKGKLVYRTDTAGTNAMDVDKVAGKPSNTIAVAVDANHRDTVNNSVHLNGKEIGYFMSKEEGNNLIKTTDSLRKKYKSEISDLRDEVYQLKNQLAKNGFIRNDGQYCGYHDLFRTHKYSHEADKLCDVSTTGLTGMNKIVVSDPKVFERLHVYDYIALKNQKINKYRVRQIKAKDKDGETITLDRDIDQAFNAETYELYKSAGIVYDASFEFAMPPTDSIGSGNFYSGVSDDSFNIYKKLNKPNTGYAYNFKIPQGKSGFLSDIELCLRAYNHPGALMCYLIDERDLPNFRNPIQAEADYKAALKTNSDSWHFFAKSQPMKTLTASEGKRYVQFSFENTQNGTYPLLPQPETNETIRYILIVEMLSGDDQNYYNLLFLQHKGLDGSLGDLQLNNTTYYYTRTETDSGLQAMSTDDTINACDMYYQVHTMEDNHNDPAANNQGLYSAIVYNENGLAANKIRTTLRIKREGDYIAQPPESPFGLTTQELTIINENKDSKIRTIENLSLTTDQTNPIELRTGDADISYKVPVAIGDSWTTIKGVSETNITVNEPLMLFKNDKVYRIGYQISVNAYNLQFNKTNGAVVLSDPKRFNLPLTKIIRDVDEEDISLSDRLVFETDLDDTYNYFEVQVYWENKNMSEYPDIRKEQMGAIKEITVSMDKFE